MKTILDSIINISKLDSWSVKASTKSENRINSVGDSLEEFIANSFTNFQDNLQLKAETFSWQGNSNNPLYLNYTNREI